MVERSGRRPGSRTGIAGGIALAAAGALAGMAGEAAAQPSFDCAQAFRPSEVAICAEPALAGLDRRIADVFFALMDGAPPTRAAQIRHQQRAFLRDRDGCAATNSGADLDACLQAAMQDRLDALQSAHTEVFGAPLMVAGDVVVGPGLAWRGADGDPRPDDAYTFANGSVLCAVGLPGQPTLGTTDAAQGGCRYAVGGDAAIAAGFSILIADTEFGWTPVSSVNVVPENAVVLWQDGDRAVSSCRALLDGTYTAGTLVHGKACMLIHDRDVDAVSTDIVLLIAGFEVMTRPE